MPKRVTVATDGEAATGDEKTPGVCCIVCQGPVKKVLCCPQCKSGTYCSDVCVIQHKLKPSHKVVCSAIVELEKMEARKLLQSSKIESKTKLPLKLNREIIRLVGEKPVVSVELEDVSCHCLWDTGSMVSVMSKSYVAQNFPSKPMFSVEEFLGGRSLHLSAANNQELPIEGVVLLDFGVVDGEVLFQIPFLVSKYDLAHPIIGYNTIEHLILNFKDKSLASLMQIIPNLSADSAQIVVNVVEEASELSDVLGVVKTVQPVRVPANCMIKVKAKTRVKIETAGEKEVLFSPLIQYEGEDDLIVYESTAVLKWGKAQFINIGIYNPTSRDIFVNKGSVMGSIVDVSMVIRFPLTPPSEVEVNSVDAGTEAEPPNPDAWIDKIDMSHLEEERREQLRSTLLDLSDGFAKEKNDIGFIPDFQMPINLTDNIPVSEPYRQVPRMLYDEVKTHINDLLANGWIRQSQSSYSSPMVCVRKKDGSLRLCIDYRKLNSKTIPDRQPIPRVQDLLDGLGGQKWFTTLDMSQAYHQGQISEESRKLTAFSTPWSLYEWVRIPYGLTNAPPCFQRYINDCLYHLRDRICIAYLDDILIYGKTFEEHLQNVETVVKVLINKGIKLNPKKCVFAKNEVRYLGRLISEQGYRADPENTVALNACKTPPKTVGNVRTLLGFLGYYRNFVKDFSRRMKPVYDLLKSEGNGKKGCLDSRKTVKWLPEHQKVVEEVVDHLQSPEVIAYPDFEKPFIVHCDASETGLGSVLYQRQQEKMRVISFASRTLTPAERNYHMHSGKLEFLALKWSVTEKFSDYLHYGPPFEVVTDNNPLTYVLTSAKLNATGLRWVARLADFKFSIRYRAGKKHIDADYLSRHPVTDFEQQVTECDQVLRHEDICLVLSEASKNRNSLSSVVDVNALTLDEKDMESVKPLTAEELMTSQQNDSVVGPVYTAVSNGQRLSNAELKQMSRATRLLFSQSKKLSMVNGVLMRQTASANQIVLPKCYHQVVYTELHQKLGHLGCEKALELARKRFYWPYMQNDIEHFIQKQCRCVISKKPNVPERAKLIPIDARTPFELVSIDYIHLDKCKGNYEYCLVVVDHFTRFIQLYPTKNKSARAAADQMFNKYILNYGFPRRIHHDQGREFDNSLFDRLHKLSGITGSRTTPYHPMGDGQPERVNRTLINMLKCLSEAEKADWKAHLPKLAFAYNSTVNKSTGFSPFYLMFGRESRLPIDLLFGIELVKEHKTTKYDAYVSNWHESMKQAVAIAQKHIDVGKRANVRNYDKKVKMVEVVVGDKVLLKNHEKGGTGKLRSFWEDMVYEVIAKEPDLPVYTIKPIDGRKKPKRVHRNLIMSCNFLPYADVEELPLVPSVEPPPVTAPVAEALTPGHNVHAEAFVPTKETEETAIQPTIPAEEAEDDEDIVVVVQDFLPGEEVEPVVVPLETEPEVEPEVEPVVESESEEHVESSEESSVDDEDVTVAYGEEDATVAYEEDEYITAESESEGPSEESSSESDSEPPRRSERVRQRAETFTYDEVGGIPSMVQL